MKFIFRITTFFFLGLLFVANADAQTQYRGISVGPYLSSTDAQEIAGWGANVIRYSLSQDPVAHYEDANGYYARLDAALYYLDAILPTLEAAGVKVIIDPGLTPGGYLSEKGKRKDRIFHEQWAADAFVNGWALIAAKYADNPTVLGYQLINEPATGKKIAKKMLNWKKLATLAAQTIRSVDSTHLIYISSEFGNPTLLGRLKGIKVSGIAYTFNYYYNHDYTHQGLYNYSFPKSYPSKKLNLKAHAKILSKVAKFKKQVGNAPVLVGEISVVRWAPNASVYLGDVLGLFEKYGFDYTVFGYDNFVWDVRYVSDIYSSGISPTPTDRVQTLEQFFLLNY